MNPLIFCSVFIAAAWSGWAGDQAQSGAVIGTVVDPKGSAVAKAKVIVTNAGTGAKVTASSGSDGSYAIRNLTPNNYEVTIEAKDFKKYLLKDVQVDGQNAVHVDVQLAYNDSTIARQEATVILDALEKTYSDGGKEHHMENGIHACRPGHAVMDVDLTSDTLFCYHISNDVSSEESQVDESTERAGLRACPDGWYVRGIRDTQQHKGTFKITFSHDFVLLCSRRSDVTLYGEKRFDGGCAGNWHYFAVLVKDPESNRPSNYWPLTIMTGIAAGNNADYDTLLCVTTQPIAPGQIDFYHLCGDCHGTDGSAPIRETRGFHKVTSRPLGSPDVQAMSNEAIQKIFTHKHGGERDRIKLSAGQIQDMISFIRTLKH